MMDSDLESEDEAVIGVQQSQQLSSAPLTMLQDELISGVETTQYLHSNDQCPQLTVKVKTADER